MLKLSLLGTPTIYLNDRPITFKTNKSHALFIYLAVNPTIHKRNMLASLLWTAMDARQARKNLRDTLVLLRSAVGDYVLVTPNGLALNQELPSQIDVNEFVAKITQGRSTGDLASIEQAIQLYQADFLAGFQNTKAPFFEDWAMQKREELHNLAIDNLYWLATTYLQKGAYEAGLQLAKRLLALEPWQESFHLLQMRLLAESGRRIAALQQFELCRQILADELGITPSQAAIAYYEQIRDRSTTSVRSEAADAATHALYGTTEAPLPRKEPPTQPPLALPAANVYPVPHNLSRPLRPLIGRQREINAIQRILNADQALTTLIGQGGIGKSRLMLEVAQQLLRKGASTANWRFRDGIWLVNLTGVDSAAVPNAVLRERCAARIGEAIGLSFTGAEKLSSQVEAFFAERHALLILDNFEELVTITDFVLELLQKAPDLQIVITSRIALNLSAEQLIHLTGLTLPPRFEQARTLVNLIDYEAVAFFITRAQQIHSNFTTDTEQLNAVVRICWATGGSPLAIILATALLDLHDCTEIATLLEQDYRILHTDQLDLPAQQRSIQGALDRSWQLLQDEQKETLACCSVFHDFFTAEAATAVVQSSMRVLHSLARQSWLVYEIEEQRFVIHDLLRQYAMGHLAEWPTQRAAVERRHAEYYMQLLQRSERLIRQEVKTVELLRINCNNLIAAWKWTIAHQRLDLLAGAGAALTTLYRLEGYFAEAYQRFAAAIIMVRKAVQAEQPEARHYLAQLLIYSTEFCQYIGNQVMLEANAREALQLGQQLHDAKIEAFATNALARLAGSKDDSITMRAQAERACALLQAGSEPWALAYCLNTLGLAYQRLGLHSVVSTTYQAALDALKVDPDYDLEARIHLNLGLYYHEQKEYMAAQQTLMAALTSANRIKSQRVLACSQSVLGGLYTNLGDYQQAQNYFQQALAIFDYVNDRIWHASTHSAYGRLLHLVGDLEGSQRNYDLAARLGIHHFQRQAHWHTIFQGHLLADKGEHGTAISYYHKAIALQAKLGLKGCQSDAFAGLAVATLAIGERRQAQLAVDQALAHFGAYEYFETYRRCVTVLKALADLRANQVLADAQRALQTHLARLTDPHLHQLFSTQAAVRELLAEQIEALS